jgi:flap endonuclease-1
VFPVDPNKIRDIFLNPKVSDNYKMEWKNPERQGIIDFLCREKEFSEERIQKTLERIEAGSKKQKGKTSLEQWFN